MPDTMTNKDMAANLGRYIIQARQRVRALEAVLTECCADDMLHPKQVNWRESAKLAEEADDSQRVSLAERRDMLQNIDAEIDENALIRVLHNQFLRKDQTNCLEEE